MMFSGVLKWKMGEIISSLPLLLYIAVFLFFLGAVGWIRSIHATVGNVLAFLAVVAALFYTATTVLAAGFASAPFRTPLSRGLYSLSRFLLWLFHRVGSTFGGLALPERFKEYATSNINPRRRQEQSALTNDWLGQRALIWLGRELSLAPHFHRRFLLLFNETMKLPQEQMEAKSFTEAPWAPILDLIGKPYLQELHSKSFTAEESGTIAWLVRAVNNPRIKALISPGTALVYEQDYRQPGFWTQFTMKQDIRHSQRTKHPNAAFLLTRDVPIPSPQNELEIQTTLRLIKWRNSPGDKSLKTWQDIIKDDTNYCDAYFHSLISCFCRYATAVSLGLSAFQMEAIFLHFRDLLALAMQRSIDRDTLITLTQTYEIMLTASEGFTVDLAMPRDRAIRELQTYAKAIRKSGNRTDHDVLTVLMARAIRKDTQEHRHRDIKELLSMVWIVGDAFDYNVGGHPWIDGLFYEDAVEQLYKSNTMNWSFHTFHTGEIPRTQFYEIVKLVLDELNESEPLHPMWLFDRPLHHKGSWANNWIRQVDITHKQKYLSRTIVGIGHFLDQECSPLDHFNVMKMLYQTLSRTAPSLRLASELLDALGTETGVTSAKDPCARLIFTWSTGADYSVHPVPTERYLTQNRRSWALLSRIFFEDMKQSDPLAICRARSSIWSAIEPKMKQTVVTKALIDNVTLVSRIHIVQLMPFIDASFSLASQK